MASRENGAFGRWRWEGQHWERRDSTSLVPGTVAGRNEGAAANLVSRSIEAPAVLELHGNYLIPNTRLRCLPQMREAFFGNGKQALHD